MKKYELFNMFNQELIDNILSHSDLPANENSYLVELRDCLYKNRERIPTGEYIEYPEEFLRFIRLLSDNQLFKYLETLIFADNEIVMVKYDGLDLLEYLLSKDLDNELTKIYTLLPVCGNFYSPFRTESLLLQAIKLEKINVALRIYYVAYKYRLILDSTILQLAVLANSLDCLSVALSKHYNVNETTIFNKKSPLMIAVSKNNMQMTQLLLDHGSNVNYIDFDSGKSVLDYCVPGSEIYELIKDLGGEPGDDSAKDIFIVIDYLEEKKLKQAENVFKRIVSRDTPRISFGHTDLFCYCLENNYIEFSKLLAPYVDEFDYEDELVKACVTKSSRNSKSLGDILTLLNIVSSVWSVDRLVSETQDILFHLSWNEKAFDSGSYDECIEVFDLLKDFGVNVIESNESLGQAFLSCNCLFVRYCLDHGMDSGEVDKLYEGIFYEFLTECFLNFTNSKMSEIYNMCKSFVEGGASVNYIDKNGNTVLHKLLSRKYETVETAYSYSMFCIEFGADLFIRNNEKLTPCEVFYKYNPKINDLYYMLRMYENKVRMTIGSLKEEVNEKVKENNKRTRNFHNSKNGMCKSENSCEKGFLDIGKMFTKTKELIEDCKYDLAYQEIQKIVSSGYSKVIYDDIDLFCLCLKSNLLDHAKLLINNVDPFDYDAELLEACFITHHQKNYQDIIKLLELIISIWPEGKIICSQEGLLLLLAWNAKLFNDMGIDNTLDVFDVLYENFGVDISQSYEAFSQAFVFCNFNYTKLALYYGMKPNVVDELHHGIFFELLDEFLINLNDESAKNLEEVCEEFINGGASLNYQDKSGNTVLHRLFLQSLVDEEILLFYIMFARRFDGDLKIKNNKGETPAETLLVNHPNLVDLYRFMKLLENE